ncbi:cytosolic phospholipase A2 beta isoform X1 [Phyllopteryx taeniolatus]|uniref:cytosolic phospholipase A2 beta isoform X1 n=2 Tax=Phyllopteryx taeniolatus TaxID=161469 RepID=UPI002AD3549D|nr:cytosolic phospholipase A2 beta isoform X1 [Phyllopteryx taeniolatus]
MQACADVSLTFAVIFPMAMNAVVSSWTLSVTVLRAENIRSTDFWSEDDCYVTLTFPPAIVFKTHTVANSKNPEWNKTFHFKLYSNLQNTLQIHLYDEDPMYDDVIQRIMFDISTLKVGKKEIKEFAIQPQGKLWISFELQESNVNAVSPHKDCHLGKEVVSYWRLNVTILKAKMSYSTDYFSESDCYVTLHLPTATASTFNTKTVHNKCNPEWNETFTFRVLSHLKNVLEIRLHDKDPISEDDLISTILFDLSNLTTGKKETMTFTLNPETTDHISIQFEMLHSEEPSCEYLSNGILLAAPFSALDINVDKLLNNSDFLGKVMKLRGACPEKQTLLADEITTLRFYINRDLETELGVSSSADDINLNSTRLQPLPPEHKRKVSVVIDKDTVDLNVETHECNDNCIAVRLDFDIPQQEKEYLKKRKLIVGQKMQQLFGLDSPPSPDQVPTIALVGSGGGSRAMTGLLGSLKSLEEIQFLDTVSYITGVSGSTWAMTALSKDENWSQDGIDSTIAELRKELCKSVLSVFSPEKLKYYKQEMKEKMNEGHIVSLTDMAGLIYEQIVFGKKITSTLSEQQRTVNEGQNPFPIYTAVSMKEKSGFHSEAEWCEFTPYEVGFLKYGTFVRAEDFGSQFFLGHLVKKLPEVRIPYLIGIWSSCFSVNPTQLFKLATGSEAESDSLFGPDIDNIETDDDPSTLDTHLIDPSTDVSRIISDFLRNRPISSKVHNFMNGLLLHTNYNAHSNFTAWKETHIDAFPNLLTPSDSILQLIDSGHHINVACAPVLRPEREVDVIISLDYSWNPDNIFRDLKMTAAYCKDHDIPFPHVDFTTLEEAPKKEVYIFEDMENPKAPIVIHFPLVNISFKQFKQPGVRRKTAEEIKAGEVDVHSSNSPFTTGNLTYSEEDFDSLVQLTFYNVANNKEAIMDTLHKVLKAKIA